MDVTEAAITIAALTWAVPRLFRFFWCVVFFLEELNTARITRWHDDLYVAACTWLTRWVVFYQLCWKYAKERTELKGSLE